jgi:excisionase family DNA binding protein
MEKLLLTPEEAAASLAISRSKFYQLLRDGAIASVRIDGCRRILPAALSDYLARLQNATT